MPQAHKLRRHVAHLKWRDVDKASGALHGEATLWGGFRAFGHGKSSDGGMLPHIEAVATSVLLVLTRCNRGRLLFVLVLGKKADSADGATTFSSLIFAREPLLGSSDHRVAVERQRNSRFSTGSTVSADIIPSSTFSSSFFLRVFSCRRYLLLRAPSLHLHHYN